jgi:nucleoside-diphosphate-sugar epimerase
MLTKSSQNHHLKIMKPAITTTTCWIACLSLFFGASFAFVTSPLHPQQQKIVSQRRAVDDDDQDNNNEAERLRQRADELRDQIRKMEEELGDKRSRSRFFNNDNNGMATAVEEEASNMSLRNKRVLVVGANGRLGSMVCRHLLRNHPQTKVTAAVHYVGVDSPTARGYARLSYEVGAEDGIGSIGPAWSSEDDRTATFQFAPEMKDYHLQNLRVVECELLDPVQCATITEDVDAIVWCATDFNDNTPRAISGLNLAFLVRAVANPTKGRVEIEGLRNILSGLVRSKQDRKWKSARNGMTTPPSTNTNSINNDPISFVMVSTTPDAFDDTGSFLSLKREGEQMLRDEFPSVTHSILRFGRFEDFFVREGLDIEQQLVSSAVKDDEQRNGRQQRLIHRRDAARAAVEALTNRNLQGQTSEVWTSVR